MSERAVQPLLIESIAIGERVGFYCAEHAAQIGADIAANGQHDPIHVKRNGNAAKLPWTLIAGLHRLRGAAGIGRTEIDAIQVADASAGDAELRRLELSENLDHRQRRPIELAIMVDARAKLEEAIDHPGRVGEASQVRAGRARQAASAIVADAGWRERTATCMGLSLRSLERLQRLHRNIVEALPDLAEQLNFHPLGESSSAMKRVADFKLLVARRRAAEAIIARPDCASIDEILSEAGLAGSTGNRDERLGAQAMTAFRGMSLHQRQAHVEWLADEMTPGMALGLVARLRDNGRLP